MAGVHVNAGELNRRIQICRTVREKIEGNYEQTREELVLGCWAKVTRVSGTRLVQSGADFGEDKVRFLIRRPVTPIDRKMFVRHEGREYAITYLNDYGGRRWLEIWGTWKSREAPGVPAEV
ncbi:MAG: phage head closure protein [Oscillospiraceae bacterium]|nr:phage head closure protein [Oscillospiraceae bacterium]